MFNILLKNYKEKYQEKILFICNFMQAILLLPIYYIYYISAVMKLILIINININFDIK